MDKKVSFIFRGVELEIVGLYLSDYSAKLHVRQVSRLLRANHRTVSLALKRLEERGVMKHETVGKNKQYFLNVDNLVTKEYLKNAESIRTIKLLEKHHVIKKLLTELAPELKNTPLILFGSYVKGEEKKGSDIDILLIKNGNEGGIINKINEFSKRHKITIQVQKTTQEQFEAGVKEKDNLVVEIIKNHVTLNNAEVFVDILWRYFNAR